MARSTRTAPSRSARSSSACSSRSGCASAATGTRAAACRSTCSGRPENCPRVSGFRTRASRPIAAGGELNETVGQIGANGAQLEISGKILSARWSDATPRDAYPTRRPMARIFDCFLFFNELDVLDIRLHELAPIVDRFVLAEARLTFSGRDKPLYFHQNRELFAPFLDRIVHVIDDDMATGGDRREREHHQRNALIRGLGEAE